MSPAYELIPHACHGRTHREVISCIHRPAARPITSHQRCVAKPPRRQQVYGASRRESVWRERETHCSTCYHVMGYRVAYHRHSAASEFARSRGTQRVAVYVVREVFFNYGIRVYIRRHHIAHRLSRQRHIYSVGSCHRGLLPIVMFRLGFLVCSPRPGTPAESEDCGQNTSTN